MDVAVDDVAHHEHSDTEQIPAVLAALAWCPYSSPCLGTGS
jgi:hypothetical protein